MREASCTKITITIENYDGQITIGKCNGNPRIVIMTFSLADSSPKAVRSKFDKNKLECDMAFDCSPQRHLAANGFWQWSIVIFRRPAAGSLLAIAN